MEANRKKDRPATRSDTERATRRRVETTVECDALGRVAAESRIRCPAMRSTHRPELRFAPRYAQRIGRYEPHTLRML